MEALQILKYSLQYYHNLNFMEGLNWDDELTKMESFHRVQLCTLKILIHLLLILARLPLILTLMLMIVFKYLFGMLLLCRSIVAPLYH